jgi:hypothetical protein
MLYLLEDRVPDCAAIQQTWLESGEELTKSVVFSRSRNGSIPRT